MKTRWARGGSRVANGIQGRRGAGCSRTPGSRARRASRAPRGPAVPRGSRACRSRRRGSPARKRARRGSTYHPVNGPVAEPVRAEDGAPEDEEQGPGERRHPRAPQSARSFRCSARAARKTVVSTSSPARGGAGCPGSPGPPPRTQSARAGTGPGPARSRFEMAPAERPAAVRDPVPRLEIDPVERPGPATQWLVAPELAEPRVLEGKVGMPHTDSSGELARRRVGGLRPPLSRRHMWTAWPASSRAIVMPAGPAPMMATSVRIAAPTQLSRVDEHAVFQEGTGRASDRRPATGPPRPDQRENDRASIEADALPGWAPGF